jgi:sugar (pentulose or hexulose) kinase
MRYFLIDVGASFIKSAIFSPEEEALTEMFRVPFPEFDSRHANRREVTLSKIIKCVSEIFAFAKSGNKEIDGVFLTGQMHGFVIIDHNFNPLSPFISWQDQRCLDDVPGESVSYFRQMRGQLSDQEWFDLGNDVKPGYPIATLYRMKRDGEIPKNALIVSLTDFIAGYLCGGISSCHFSNAASHGLFSIAEGKWSNAALNLIGIDERNLLEPIDAIAEVGRCIYSNNRTPVFCAIGDQQTSLLGVGLGKNELSVNVSTGSQVSMISEKSTPGAYQLRPYFSGLYLRSITHIPAGRALNAWLGFVTELNEDGPRKSEDIWRLVIQKVGDATTGRNTQMNVDLSVFSSAFGAGGAVENIWEDELNIGTFFRAAFDSMIRNYARAKDIIDVDRQATIAVFSGGLIDQVDYLRHRLTTALGLAVRRSTNMDDALRGLSKVASFALDPSSKLIEW